MQALYRNPFWLPSWMLALLLVGCDPSPPPKTASGPVSDRYLEMMQQAEALKYEIAERRRQQQQIDALLDGAQDAPR